MIAEAIIFDHFFDASATVGGGAAAEADSLNKKVWAQTELWGKSVPDLKIAFFKKSLVLARTKLSMGLA